MYPIQGLAKMVLVLGCQHTLIFQRGYAASIPVGEELWCVKCQKYQELVNKAGEYRVRCRACKYSRGFALSRKLATAKAVEHCRNKGHIVTVVHLGKVLERFTPDGGHGGASRYGRGNAHGGHTPILETGARLGYSPGRCGTILLVQENSD